jgi:hypothetical protein
MICQVGDKRDRVLACRQRFRAGIKFEVVNLITAGFVSKITCDRAELNIVVLIQVRDKLVQLPLVSRQGGLPDQKALLNSVDRFFCDTSLSVCVSGLLTSYSSCFLLLRA